MDYWEANNKDDGWDDFLLAVKKQFDPDPYEDYVGQLATLRQPPSVEVVDLSVASNQQLAAFGIGEPKDETALTADWSRTYQRATPVRKPHTSTSDLLTWSEAPSPAVSSAANAARANQPSDGVGKVLFGGQINDEDAQNLNERKPCSSYKLKEMNGSKIIASNSGDGIPNEALDIVDDNEQSAQVQALAEADFCTEFHEAIDDGKYLGAQPSTEDIITDSLSQHTLLSRQSKASSGELTQFTRSIPDESDNDGPEHLHTLGRDNKKLYVEENTMRPVVDHEHRCPNDVYRDVAVPNDGEGALDAKEVVVTNYIHALPMLDELPSDSIPEPLNETVDDEANVVNAINITEAKDGRSIPPRDEALRLGRISSMVWRPPLSRIAYSISSSESLLCICTTTPRFTGDPTEVWITARQRCDPTYYTVSLDEPSEYRVREDEHGKKLVQWVEYSNMEILVFGLLVQDMCFLYLGDDDQSNTSYELKESPKKSWMIFDPKHTLIAARALSGHKTSHPMRMLTVSSVVITGEGLADLKNFCQVPSRRSMTKFMGSVNALCSGVNASHCDETEGIARCLVRLVKVEGSFLEFDSWTPLLLVIIGDGFILGMGRTWAAAVVADLCKAVQAASCELEEVVLNVVKEVDQDSSLNSESAEEGLVVQIGVEMASMDANVAVSQSQHHASPIYAYDKPKEVNDFHLISSSSTTAGDSPILHSESTKRVESVPDVLLQRFPNLRLEDKAFLLGGGVDRDSDTTLADTTSEPSSSDPCTTSVQPKAVNESSKDDGPAQAGVTSMRPRRRTSRPARYRDYSSK